MEADQNRTPTYPVGTRVRVSLPDPDGPDAQYDGREATVTEIAFDDLGGLADREELDEMYTLEFDSGESPGLSFRVHDIEPVE